MGKQNLFIYKEIANTSTAWSQVSAKTSASSTATETQAKQFKRKEKKTTETTEMGTTSGFN